ncbi:MAG: hypothetical protein ABIP02_07220 [Arenimonas sp.]
MHIGIGLGSDAKRYIEWNLTSVVLVDADKSLTERMGAVAQAQTDWHILNKYISSATEIKDYFVATKSSENGAINPDLLKPFWKNIATKEVRKIESTTLDAELPKIQVLAPINWLVIDCLPALPVLMGANEILKQCDVAVIRLIVDSKSLQIPGAKFSEIEENLSGNGFRFIGFEEELQPEIANALFVRDWKNISEINTKELLSKNQLQIADNKDLVKKLNDSMATLARQADEMTGLQGQVAEFKSKHQEQTKLANEKQVLIDRLVVARDEYAKQANENAERGKKLAAESSTVQAKLAEQTMLVATWQSKHQELMKLANERQVLVDRLTKVRDEYAKQANENAERAKKLAAENAATQAKVTELQKLMSDLNGKHNEQVKLADDRQALIDRLSVARDEHAKQANENAERAKKLVAENAAAQAKVLEVQKLLSELHGKHDEQMKLANERKVLVDRLVIMRDESAKRDKEYSAQKDQLVADNLGLQTKIAELQKLASELQGKHLEQSNLAVERQVLIQRLTNVRDEFAKNAQEQTQRANKLAGEQDAALAKIVELQKQLSDTQSKHQAQLKLVDEKQDLAERLAKVRDEHVKVSSERQIKIEQLQKSLNEQAALLSERQQLTDDLKQIRDEQTRLESEHQAKIGLVQKSVDEQTRLVAERQTLVDSLVKVRDSHAKLAAERLLQIEQMQKDSIENVNRFGSMEQQLERAMKDIVELKQDLSDGRQTTAINTRLLALREADLRDLQSKYQASVSTQDSQHQMLVKLSERLSTASRYFHQLADQQVKTSVLENVLPAASNKFKLKAIAKPKAKPKAKVKVIVKAKLPTQTKPSSKTKAGYAAKAKPKVTKKVSKKARGGV